MSSDQTPALASAFAHFLCAEVDVVVTQPADAHLLVPYACSDVVHLWCFQVSLKSCYLSLLYLERSAFCSLLLYTIDYKINSDTIGSAFSVLPTFVIPALFEHTIDLVSIADAAQLLQVARPTGKNVAADLHAIQEA